MANDFNIDDYYTVDKVAEIKGVGLKKSRISQLFKEEGVKKIGNKYYATKEQVIAILNRKNQTIKTYTMGICNIKDLL